MRSDAEHLIADELEELRASERQEGLTDSTNFVLLKRSIQEAEYTNDYDDKISSLVSAGARILKMLEETLEG